MDGLNRLSSGHRKTAYALKENVERLSKKHGVERLGFLTLTFADHVVCAKEAGRRYNSLSTHVLSKRYGETIAVLERMKSGRIHYHLLVVLAVDVRTGFDFAQASNGVYSSASPTLRAEWAFWRETAKRYGFGRTELLPVKSSGEAIAKYVGKYISKHIEQREGRDKGVRLVRYSKGASFTATRFMFESVRSKLWRHQVGAFAKRNQCEDVDALAAKFGPRWAWWKRGEIMSIEPSDPSLWEAFECDRLVLAHVLGRALGVDYRETYAAMYQRQMQDPDPHVNVPRITWPPTIRQIQGATNVTTVWNHGEVADGAGCDVGHYAREDRRVRRSEVFSPGTT